MQPDTGLDDLAQPGEPHRAAGGLPGAVLEKYRSLRASLRQPLEGGLIVAYSGGVDSAFLLWAAEQERRAGGGRLLAVTAVSPSLSEAERGEAGRFASFAGVEHRWERSGEFSNPDYVRNDGARCYHCKSELFRLSRTLAQELGCASVAYGYNASDRSDVRPGHRAAQENGILAPLDGAGLSKEEIRLLMRNFGLPLADKPASPCLSSRLMPGVSVTPERLRDVEDLEAILRRGGLRIFRVRLHDGQGLRLLRIEVDSAEMTMALALREELVEAARARGYPWITLDLAGYRTAGTPGSGAAQLTGGTETDAAGNR